MARGFLSGAIWGTVLSVGGLGAMSVLMPKPDTGMPPAPQDRVEVAEPVVQDEVEDTTSALDPSPAPDAPVTEPQIDDAAVSGTDDPQSPAAPAEDSEIQTATDDTAQPATPEPAPATEDPVNAPAQESEASADQESVAADTANAGTATDASVTAARRPADVAPVTPVGDAPSLDTPVEARDAAPTDTAAAPVPTPETGAAIPALDAPDAGSAPSMPPVTSSYTTPGGTTAPSLNAPNSETGPRVSTEPAQPPAPPVPAVAAPLVPETEPEPPATEDTATDAAPSLDSAGSERPPVRRLIPSAPDADTADTPVAAAPRPAIGTPAASLTDRNPGNSARLPSIGSGDDTAAAPDAPAVTLDDSLPPLQRFAAPVDSDPALPKMSIVMIDDGTGPLGPDTLDGFPFPVTFALDPAQPGAADRMSAYRALGYEVAALMSVPNAAQPSDVEQILGGAIAAVPEAVALIEAPGGGLQADRSVTEQATSFAAESGHGLIFLPNGLNTAQAIAQRETVPSLSILRDFDGDGQDARTKRRFLDGAAFRARQDGAVVMLGRLTPDTLSALVLWSLQDRASSVSMVPVSALLLEQAN